MQRRERLIEAAIKQFGVVGYHATTVRSVVAEAGLTNRYFYESFETMEDLLVACYEELMANHYRRLEAALAGAKPTVDAQIAAGVRCFFEEMRDPHVAKITQVEVLGVSPRVNSMYVRSMKMFATLLTDKLVPAGASADTVDKRELSVVGFALTAAMTSSAAMWMGTHYKDSIETMVSATMKVIRGTARELRVAQKSVKAK